MIAFVKDLFAFVALGGFTVSAIAWLDAASRLV
jgi:hypothetical protein